MPTFPSWDILGIDRCIWQQIAMAAHWQQLWFNWWMDGLSYMTTGSLRATPARPLKVLSETRRCEPGANSRWLPAKNTLTNTEMLDWYRPRGRSGWRPVPEETSRAGASLSDENSAAPSVAIPLSRSG